MRNGTEKGVLVKGGRYLEALSEVDTVVFDKTGTLTQSTPVLSDVIPVDGVTSEEELLRLASCLEEHFPHPVSRAIVRQAQERGVIHENEVHDTEVRYIVAHGICSSVAGRRCFLGSRHFVQDDEGIDISPAKDAIARLSSEGKSILYLAVGNQLAGVLGIEDPLRPEAKEAIAALRERGITKIMMLTGDDTRTAAHVAAKLGLDGFHAQVLPQDKAKHVLELKAQGRKVLMVGDGINDSAALAQANLSIAMGKGSDIAMDVAKMTLISSDLNKITDAIRLSQATVRTIRENLFWAFIYNLIGIPVAAGILYPINGFLLNPMIAGAAMAMSSVSVVSNSLRLKRKKFAHTTVTVQEEVQPTEETTVPTTETATPQPETTAPSASENRKTYLIEGMMCDHCRTRVEKVLNMWEGASAQVTLTPPEAIITFQGKVPALSELQQLIDEKAGDYTLKEKN